jgi:hypothetical protein
MTRYWEGACHGRSVAPLSADSLSSGAKTPRDATVPYPPESQRSSRPNERRQPLSPPKKERNLLQDVTGRSGKRRTERLPRPRGQIPDTVRPGSPTESLSNRGTATQQTPGAGQKRAVRAWLPSQVRKAPLPRRFHFLSLRTSASLTEEREGPCPPEAHQVVLVLEGEVQLRDPAPVPIHQHIPLFPEARHLRAGGRHPRGRSKGAEGGEGG